MHKPIKFHDFTLSLPHKTCFSTFNGQILFGDRIAIIGKNGAGKSTLLKQLHDPSALNDDVLTKPRDLRTGYLPQIIETSNTLSGGERINQALTHALLHDPNLLLLDEPTNHLDASNRRSLMNLLRRYTGTLVIVSHDVELLRQTIDTFWHIENEKIHIFKGRYDDYVREHQQKHINIEEEIAELKQQQKGIHTTRMQEQQRVAKSRASGEKKIANKKWLKTVGDLKGMKAEKSQGKKQKALDETMEHLLERRSQLYVPDVITPQFSLYPKVTSQAIITIHDGSVGYQTNEPILKNLHLSMHGQERVALLGDNGSGKSTLIKGILQRPDITREGDWMGPKREKIGYLDQHYETLSAFQTVFDAISAMMPNSDYREIRKHLNDFLFRKNEEVNAPIATLSGGEKARLSLCCIAAKPPTLLILDEMTNNIDLETKEHVIQILKTYEGAMLIISHDEHVISNLNLDTHYRVQDGSIFEVAKEDLQ